MMLTRASKTLSGEIRGFIPTDIIELENVEHRFGNICALQPMNLSIKRGEFVFLTGASGAGKTTLLKIIAGEILPSQGKVVVGKMNPAQSNSLFISQVFQDVRLLDNFSCRENLHMAFDPSVYANAKEFEQDLDELAKIFGIHDRLEHKPHSTNGGMRQKIAIIRALLSRPDILIADEPTSSLDFDNSRKLFEVLNLYNLKRKLTVIWASHNRELVKKFAGRIVHLDRGKLVYSGHACFI